MTQEILQECFTILIMWFPSDCVARDINYQDWIARPTTWPSRMQVPKYLDWESDAKNAH